MPTSLNYFDVLAAVVRGNRNQHYLSRTDDHLNTPLHLGTELNSFRLCQKIVQHGGDINAKNRSGHTPFRNALVAKRMKFVKMYLNHGANVSESLDLDAVLVALKCKPHIRDAVFNRGLNIDKQDEDGNSYLHHAMADKYPKDAVELLLDNGINFSLTNREDKTALDMVMNRNATDEKKYLLLTHMIREYSLFHNLPESTMRVYRRLRLDRQGLDFYYRCLNEVMVMLGMSIYFGHYYSYYNIAVRPIDEIVCFLQKPRNKRIFKDKMQRIRIQFPHYAYVFNHRFYHIWRKSELLCRGRKIVGKLLNGSADALSVRTIIDYFNDDELARLRDGYYKYKKRRRHFRWLS